MTSRGPRGSDRDSARERIKTKNIFTNKNKAEDLVRALVGDDAIKIHTTQNKQTTKKK